jgi:hypothetical protein
MLKPGGCLRLHRSLLQSPTAALGPELPNSPQTSRSNSGPPNQNCPLIPGKIDGDPDARGEGSDVHTLRVPEITHLQETYLDKVVSTVGDLDHILWEISNESPQESLPWQYHLIHYLRSIDPTITPSA